MVPAPPIDRYSYRQTAGLSVGAIVVIVGLHAGALAWLVWLDVLPLRTSLPATALMVRIVEPAPPSVTELAPIPPSLSEVSPPRPRTVEHRRAPQAKAQAQLPSVDQPPSHAMEPEAQVVAARDPAPRPDTQASVLQPSPEPSAPATVTRVRFDADYLQNPAPAYPVQSRRIGEEGKVVLRVFVEPGGRPSQIEVKTPSGSLRLDVAAQEAVWRWKFVPARLGGEAVGAWVLVPIVFNLKG